MSNVRFLLRNSVSSRSISILFCNYFSVRRISLYSKFASETSKEAFQNCITFTPVGIDRIWPFVAVLSKSIGNYQSVTTQASVDEQELTDEDLNRILSAVENDPVSSKDTCTFYIEKLCRSGNLSDAARLLQGLRDKQIFLSPNTYNILLTAAGEGSDFDLLSHIFKDLLLSCNSLGSISYSNFAKAFRKATNPVSLLKIVTEVSELTFPRSATVINRIIYCFAKSGQIDKALLIFDHMKNLKCKPDIVTHNTVLEILGRAGHVDEMLHEFASMKEASMVPDIISYNTLINSLRKMGRLDLCLVFLQEMSEGGLGPDLRTYTALIESFGRSGRMDEALRLFGEMKSRGIRPSIYIYRALISNLKKVGKLALAMSLVEEMNSCISDLVGPKDFKRKNR